MYSVTVLRVLPATTTAAPCACDANLLMMTAMEALEQRFGSHLSLSEKELVGIQITAEECGDLWYGSAFTLVVRVLTNRAVHSEGFIGLFTRLWRGLDGVSIKEIGERRFLARFVSKKDKLRVLDMEPWAYRDNLVLLAETHVGMDAREVEAHHCTFWVQFHGIPPFNMATQVARKIGSIMGRVVEVDQAEGDDCIGRFLRVRLQIDIRQPLMRGAFVHFPNEGSKWVSFRYEYLPEYCFVCGYLGHPSRTCVEKLGEVQAPADNKNEMLKSYAGLEAEEDLRGRRLRTGGRSGFRGGPGNNGRSDDPDGPRGSVSPSRGGGRYPNASGPIPRGLAFNEAVRYHPPPLAARIRLQRDTDERERRLREEAWDAGLHVRLGVFGTYSQEESATNQSMQEEPVGDGEPMGGGDPAEEGEPEGTRLVDELGRPRVGLVNHEGLSTEVGNNTVLGDPSQGSDPFNLGPIIEQAMPGPFQGRQRRKNKRDYAETMRFGQDKETLDEMVHYHTVGTSGKKARPNRDGDALQVEETGLNGSPREP